MMTMTTTRTDLVPVAAAADRVEYLRAVQRWGEENSANVQKVELDKAGLVTVTIDPDITDPLMSQFQTEMDTLKDVDEVVQPPVFTHI